MPSEKEKSTSAPRMWGPSMGMGSVTGGLGDSAVRKALEEVRGSLETAFKSHLDLVQQSVRQLDQLFSTLEGRNGGSNEIQQTMEFAPTESWQPNLNFYREQRALQFTSEEELDKALGVIWHDDTLRDVPRAHVGDNTIIIPATAVEPLRRSGLQFSESRVKPAVEATPNELSTMRRERGPF